MFLFSHTAMHESMNIKSIILGVFWLVNLYSLFVYTEHNGDESPKDYKHKKFHSVEKTNKMQPCNRIYYSTIHWRLNMFRAAYRSSSGALTVFAASGLHTHVVTGHSQVWVGTGLGIVPVIIDQVVTHMTTWSIITGTIPKPVPTQTWLRPVTTCICKPGAANKELLMMSSMPLETRWAFNERWNNEF